MSEHDRHEAWRSRQRKLVGYADMSVNMFEVLAELNVRDEHGYVWRAVDCDPRTIRALVKRDWVVRSDGAVRITSRGVRAYEAYGQKYRRDDGLCPQCGERETYRNWGYCRACDRAMKKKREKDQAYCKPCYLEMRDAVKRRKFQRIIHKNTRST